MRTRPLPRIAWTAILHLHEPCGGRKTDVDLARKALEGRAVLGVHLCPIEDGLQDRLVLAA